jgi:hypothetical protein
MVEIRLFEYIDDAFGGSIDPPRDRVIDKIIDSSGDGQRLQLFAHVAVEYDDFTAPASDK